MVYNITDIKNKYNGERIFIVGNGPSLNQTPLTNLTDEYSFAMGGINKIFSRTEWRPSFYFNTIPEPDQSAKERSKENADLGIPCFLPERHREEYYNHENNIYLNYKPLDHTNQIDDLTADELQKKSTDYLLDYWSSDIEEMVYFYHSMYSVLQIVAYMGFDQIYLIGCDLGYGENNSHMVFDAGPNPLHYLEKSDKIENDEYRKWSYFRDATASRTILRSGLNAIVFKLLSNSNLRPWVSKVITRIGSGGDENHFSKDYTHKPIDVSSVNEEIIKSHIIAKKILSQKDIDIFNSTIGGNLEVYTRMDFKELFRKS
jgi:hypothetical protein